MAHMLTRAHAEAIKLLAPQAQLAASHGTAKRQDVRLLQVHVVASQCATAPYAFA